ncbi:MAG: hypothetical protein MUE41_06355 [Gemmatimonadaceae bacterium]|nr:hypothetical protein [Gemmatimonadaceae bacterium]
MPSRAGIAGLGLLLLASVVGCDRGGSGTSFAGDGENLDSLAARGDSIAALAMRGFTAADSAQAVAEGAQRVRDEISRRTRDTTTTEGRAVTRATAAETSAGQVIVGASPVVPPRVATDLPAASPVPPPIAGDLSRARALGDSIRGIVAVVGSAPMTQVVVRLTDGSTVTLNGMAASDIGRVAGTEVMVRGVRTTPMEMVAAEFAVRTVEGMPAADGMLVATSDGLVLLGRDGTRRQVSNAPPSLRALAGARVWIAGSLERPTAFGRISRGR